MVRLFQAMVLSAFVYLCQPTTGHASPIEIDFSGTLSQATAGGCAYCGAYTATISFDTADGLFQQTGQNSYYFSTIDPAYFTVQFSNGISIYGGGYIAWSPGLLSGNIGGYYSHLALPLPGDGIRYIQHGTCGSYCSFIGVDNFSVSGVPGPVLGAGFPGFLMAVAGFIGWRRSRRARAL